MNNNRISVVECSPVLDVIAIGLFNGEIIIFNIREDEILF